MFIDIHKRNKNFWYPHLKDSKTSEDMLSIKKLAGLYFKYENVINFLIIGFVTMKTKKTLIENILN